MFQLNGKYVTKKNVKYYACEKQNLSYIEINKEILEQKNIPYSFYRSDFRGSLFNGVNLNKTLFDRADFIDTKFVNVEFESVIFGGSEHKNTIYDSCFFKKCSIKGTVCTSCIFINCVFVNIHFQCTMDRCKYINCQFINCVFNKSSIEEVTYKNCEMNNVDLAQCHAENLIFIDSKLRNVCFGAPFIPNYLIRETSLDDVKLKYRGKVISHNKYLEEFESKLLANERYFEYLNISIIIKQTFSYELFNFIFKRAIKLDVIKRKYHILNILKMLDFYFSYQIIDFSTYIKIVYFLENFNWDSITFDESIDYRACLYVIKERLNYYQFDFKYLNAIDSSLPCEFTLRLNYNDKNKAIQDFKNLINEFSSISNDYNGEFTILGTQQGSVILWVLGSLQLICLLGFMINKYKDDRISRKIKLECIKASISKSKDLIKKAKTSEELLKINQDIEKISKLNDEKFMNDFNKIANSLFISEIISLVISVLI